jgi:hypothetical protein
LLFASESPGERYMQELKWSKSLMIIAPLVLVFWWRACVDAYAGPMFVLIFLSRIWVSRLSGPQYSQTSCEYDTLHGARGRSTADGKSFLREENCIFFHLCLRHLRNLVFCNYEQYLQLNSWNFSLRLGDKLRLMLDQAASVPGTGAGFSLNPKDRGIAGWKKKGFYQGFRCYRRPRTDLAHE